MRILMLVGEFPTISETFIVDQIRGLSRQGHEVNVLALRPKRETAVQNSADDFKNTVYYAASGKNSDGRALFLKKGVSLYSKQSRNMIATAIWLTLTRLLKKGLYGPAHFFRYSEALCEVPEPDILVAHFGPNGDLAVRLKDALGLSCPIATFFHGNDISQIIKKNGPDIYDTLFKKGDLFLPVSDFFLGRLLKLGCPASRSFVQRMPVDLKLFPEPAQGSYANSGEFKFLTIGRLVEKKGHLDTLRAFARTKFKNPSVAMKLTLIGEGPLRSNLESLILELGVGDSVTLAGSQSRDRVLDHLSKCDVFVLPSVTSPEGDMEGFPVSILEAMAMGLPVLSTRHSGIPELIKEGINGFLVDEHDVEALHDAMQELIGNRKLAEKMGALNRSEIHNQMGADDWNKLLSERLERVCNPWPSAGKPSAD